MCAESAPVPAMGSVTEDAKGIATRMPRWHQLDEPAASIVRVQSVRSAVLEGASALAGECGVVLHDVLLAAVVVVLRTVTAEQELTVGYRAPSASGMAQQSSLRVTVADRSWRELVLAMPPARAAARPGATDYEVVLDLTGTGYQTVGCDRPVGCDRVASHGIVLVIAFRGDECAGEFRIQHRNDVVDAEYAHRLGGYLVRALDIAVQHPDAAHAAHSLLDDEEIRHQVHGLAGPCRPIGKTMVPALFAEQVALHPHKTAVTHGQCSWTYQELAKRADRIAGVLLEQGLAAEDVVGVVTERTLQWAAATLAILRAGGVYLPIRPQFPAERVRTQLDQSGARFVLTEAGSHATLDAALELQGRRCIALRVEDMLASPAPAPVPPVATDPCQLAYIYFTSGSTGLPKGAMCEHASMLNHIRAKVDDLGIDAQTVVSQTASQCFDISLWQLVAPLLVGGEVRIIDTETLLDVPRFLDELCVHGVGVAQLVPSYFEVLLSELERHPRDLGALKTVCITGEALKLDLVHRWFVRYPDIVLVNAYGATEVADDTMHEVLTGPPGRGFVTVGRPLPNVNTYIVDAGLRLVPLGTPGEVVFSGVCVGRGYINDQERTREAFVEDPYRPGTQLYRTGDFGRWLPEGKIEFLGRRDQQVKIRGFRVEINEIEARLLESSDVRDCAVVVDGDGETRKLVGFYTGPDGATGLDVRDELAAVLPDYMVPSSCHRLESLPLTENGKVDRKILRRLAATLGYAGVGHAAPITPAENALATTWAEVLNVPVERIGRDDRFFQLGGTSLAAVQLVVRLDRRLSLRDLANDPALGELALLLDERSHAARSGAVAVRARLLQRLSRAHVEGASLVCIPYAGGNAVNFQALARKLESSGIAVYGVELPGHDLGRDNTEFGQVQEVAAALLEEITEQLTGPLAIWGHCAGAAHALELARLLEAHGVRLAGVFVGAAPFSDERSLRAEIAEVTRMTNHEIITSLREDSSYVELDDLKPERMDLVGSAYRHDVVSANEHLLRVLREPAAYRLATVLHVVVAADDAWTRKAGTEGWQTLCDRVAPHVLDYGGHYFVRTVAGEVAAHVASVIGVTASAIGPS